MANYRELSHENEELFAEVENDTSIPQWVTFGLLANDKQKEIYKINKVNDIVEKLTDGINFVIIINEEIFDQLNLAQQKMIFYECLAGIVYDSEKDKIIFNKPDFITYTGLLNRYGHDDIITLKESIKSLYDQKKQQEKEEKEAKKKKKKGNQ
jgi:hypothetical protein